VVRIFSSYVPTRLLVLLFGEIVVACTSFLLAVRICFGGEGVLPANPRETLEFSVGVVLAILCLHYLGLHGARRPSAPEQLHFRILMFAALPSLTLAILCGVFPNFAARGYVFFTGFSILAAAWTGWRWAYSRLISMPKLREKVYLLGTGERANRIREAIETRPDLGMDLVEWSKGTEGESLNMQLLAETFLDLAQRRAVDRVIVALPDRRGMLPVNELLELRLNGILIDDGTSLLEKLTGQIDIDELHPSWMIFGDGFRLNRRHRFLRQFFSTLVALTFSVATLPLIPLIALFICATSPGPLLYRQKRVGLRGRVFDCLKFRTMRPDAEADSGPTWASDDDPRITNVGKFLRRTRLDEIPQAWNVLRGDMAFVGPRPERPEFVVSLKEQVPYYNVRHAVRPGITGWAQVNYGYGSSVEEAKEKLRFDLYYIRNVSVMLDLKIVLYTFMAVIRGRGVR
jgi:sugar transferase (PEP-CTERM system associated)